MPDPKAYNPEYRPESYWAAANPQQAILANVKGDLRRQMIRDLLARGEPIEAELLEENTTRETRAALERQDFRWMGGEYLPDHEGGEVEIARMTMESVTQDVYSIRARRAGKRIRYRIVDEYAMNWSWSPKSSMRPLTMAQIVRLIDTAELEGEGPSDFTDTMRDDQFEQNEDPGQAAGYVSVTSEFYPQLQSYYEEKAEEWFARRNADLEWDEAIDEEDEEDDEAAEEQHPSVRTEAPAALAEQIANAGSTGEIRGLLANTEVEEAEAWTCVAEHARFFSGPLVEEILAHHGTATLLLGNPHLPQDRTARTLSQVAESLLRVRHGQANAERILMQLARAGLLDRFPGAVQVLRGHAAFKSPPRPAGLTGIGGAYWGWQFEGALSRARAAEKILAAMMRMGRG